MKKETTYGRRVIISSPNIEGNKLLAIYDEEKGTMCNFSTRKAITGQIDILEYIDKTPIWWEV